MTVPSDGGVNAGMAAGVRTWAARIALILVGVGVVHLLAGPLIESADRLAFDAALRRQAITRPAEPAPYVLVEIDDASVEALGRFPWPRSLFAELLTRTTAGRARVVAIDVIFSEAADSAGDALLAQELAAGGNVVLASAATFARGGDGAGGGPLGALRSAERILEPLPALAAAAAGVANITVLEDGDGSLRRYPLVLRRGDVAYPSMAQAVADFVSDEGPVSAPLEGDGTIRINYGSLSPAAVARVSFSDVLGLGGSDLLRLFSGKVVFVAATYTGGVDFGPTPLATRTPAVFAHVYALHTVRTGRHLTQLSFWVSVFFGALIILLLLPMRHGHPVRMVGTWVAVSASFLLGVAGLFLVWGYMLPPALPVLASAVFVGGHGVDQWRRNLIARRNAEAFLERFVGAKLRARRATGALSDQVQDVELAILSLSLVDFAATTRGLDPLTVVGLVRRAHAEALAAIQERGGTVDRVTGDGLVAYWGYPRIQPDGASRALQAALDLRNRFRVANAELRERGLPGLSVRMGIATGRSILADVGTETAADFTVVGRYATLAARLRDTAPDGGIHICDVTKDRGKEALPGPPFEQPPLESDGFDEPVPNFLVERPFRIWSDRRRDRTPQD